MLTWQEFSRQCPEMAQFGVARLRFGVMYLATVRADGFPRVHPITAFVGSGHLYAFMEPTSPKAKDLQRNGRYAMHSLVTDSNGTNGEFQFSGLAEQVTDPATRGTAVAASPYRPQDRYILFEFKLDRCLTNEYVNGNPNARRWRLS
ncbi:MAG: pyridoxamine 5'-phosphate oxidase family protein [Candidatus Xenobia bacterium]